MEKKKNTRDINTLWPLFSYRQFGSNFLWRNFDPKFSSLGFTLIELLIVIAVIGVMAVGIVTILDPLGQIQKAQDAKRKSDLSQIQKALETYYQDNGRYPIHSITYSPLYRIVRLDETTAEWGTEFQPYMSILPKDPASTKNYVYYSSSDGQTYYIYASLDKEKNDPQVCSSPLPSIIVCPSALANNVIKECGGYCNYGVSSPNVSP